MLQNEDNPFFGGKVIWKYCGLEVLTTRLFEVCEHHTNKTHYPKCQKELYPSPECVEKCPNKEHKTPFNEDKHYGDAPYVPGSVNDIMVDIYTNGPVASAFEVYEDFMHYEKGVYHASANSCNFVKPNNSSTSKATAWVDMQ